MSSQPAHQPSAADSPRQIFLAWDRLRVQYNIILIAWTLAILLFLQPDAFYRPRVVTYVWPGVLIGAVVANVCFFAGPAMEAYITWLIRRPARLRLPLFLLGMLFTMALASVHLLLVALHYFPAPT